MRILTQTAGLRDVTSPRGALCCLAIATALWVAAGSAQAQSGQIRCSVTENGTPARGTIAVERDGREIAGGSCGGTIAVPVGRYRATVRLDGALDNPSKSTEVQVNEGKMTPVKVDFQTGVLEVRIETKGRAGTGMVIVNRGSKRIGTLGSGVAARLSAGSYEVVVRYGGQEQRHKIDLRPGQRRVVRAQF